LKNADKTCLLRNVYQYSDFASSSAVIKYLNKANVNNNKSKSKLFFGLTQKMSLPKDRSLDTCQFCSTIV